MTKHEQSHAVKVDNPPLANALGPFEITVDAGVLADHLGALDHVDLRRTGAWRTPTLIAVGCDGEALLARVLYQDTPAVRADIRLGGLDASNPGMAVVALARLRALAESAAPTSPLRLVAADSELSVYGLATSGCMRARMSPGSAAASFAAEFGGAVDPLDDAGQVAADQLAPRNDLRPDASSLVGTLAHNELAALLPFAGGDPGHLSSIHISRGGPIAECVATNGHTLAVLRTETSWAGESAELTLPAAAIATLTALAPDGASSLYRSGRSVALVGGRRHHGDVTVRATLHESYIPYRDVVPDLGGQAPAIVSSRDLNRVVHEHACDAMRSQLPRCHIVLQADESRIRVCLAGRPGSEQLIDATNARALDDTPVGPTGWNVGVDAQYLLQALEFVGAGAVELYGGCIGSAPRPYVLRRGDRTVLVMPARV